jgi:hypothetical protein
MINDEPKGQDLTKLERAAVELGKKTLRDRVQLIPSTDARVRARRALQQGVPEVIDYLAKAKEGNFDAGNDWYRNDISKMEATTRDIFPETKSPEKMVIFKALLASLSGVKRRKTIFKSPRKPSRPTWKTASSPVNLSGGRRRPARIKNSVATQRSRRIKCSDCTSTSKATRKLSPNTC